MTPGARGRLPWFELVLCRGITALRFVRSARWQRATGAPRWPEKWKKREQSGGWPSVPRSRWRRRENLLSRVVDIEACVAMGRAKARGCSAKPARERLVDQPQEPQPSGHQQEHRQGDQTLPPRRRRRTVVGSRSSPFGSGRPIGDGAARFRAEREGQTTLDVDLCLTPARGARRPKTPTSDRRHRCCPISRGPLCACPPENAPSRRASGRARWL